MTSEASSQNMLEVHMSTICHMVDNFLLKANTKISHRIKIVFPRKKAMAPLILKFNSLFGGDVVPEIELLLAY